MQINRVWQMPNKNTFDIKPIKEIIDKYKGMLPKNAVIVDPFANKNKIANITNDLDEQYDTTHHMDATDFLKMLDTNSADMLLYDPPYCYDSNTEVLTSNGWKRVSSLTSKDVFVALNTDTNEVEYQEAVHFTKQKYSGKMILINTSHINLLVTPQHRCFIRKDNEKKYGFVVAEDLFADFDKCYFKTSVNGKDSTECVVSKAALSCEEYDGYVYCVTVPNSIIFVKRNEKTCWCGNSPRQVSECYKNFGKTVNMQTIQSSYWSMQKEEIGRVVKTNGYVITCSWNSGGIGKKYGFEIVEILLVPHGGWHNDTIVVVEKKIH